MKRTRHFLKARYLKVGQRFLYRGGRFIAISRSNKGTIGAVYALRPWIPSTDCPGYWVLSQDRLVEAL